jgi:hypothetical protein
MQAYGYIQLLAGTPKPIATLPACVFQHPQLTGANIVNEPMQRQAPFADRFLDSRMLPQHLDGMLDIELS